MWSGGEKQGLNKCTNGRMTSCVACGKKEEYMELGALKTEGEEHR
jgi:hypothetical protein